MYRYYSKMRPVAPGTFPRGDVLEIRNFDARTYIPALECSAWGYIDYKAPLTEKAAAEYELIAGNITEQAGRPEGKKTMKKTAKTNALEMPRPVGVETPAQMSMSFTDGDFSLTLNLPAAFYDGTFNEWRKRFKLVARYASDAGKALIDAWFTHEIDLCAVTYWGTRDEKAQRREMKAYGKLTQRRALWESLTPDVIRAAAEQDAEPEAAAVETAPAAEPEAQAEPKAEPKAEQAARPEGRKPMNANFDFFAGCENEDAARKRYYQLSKVYHPDTGIGDTATMAVITDQYSAFMGRSSVVLDIPELPAGVIALPEHCETPAAVDEAAEYVDAIAAILKLNLPGVEAEICGKWVWVSGLNAEMKEAHAALKAAGYRFSGGKKMWYWVPSSEKGQKKRYRGTASMGYIRAKYGSRKLSDELSA